VENILSNAVDRAYQENRTLRNTFILLSLTFGFSMLLSIVSILLQISTLNPILTLGVYFALLIAIHKFENSYLGVVFCFALTGWLGFTIGPLISTFLIVNPMVVVNAFLLTSLIFASLSLYALISKKNFSFMGAWLSVSILAAFLTGLVSLFFNLPLLGLAVSAAFVILSSGVILWQLSDIVHGGESNYIRATVTLFVSIYNIFLSLLNILGYNNS
jgi:modulator of FtsH protease